MLETKIHRLEEVNSLCGSETTFALIQISGQERANPWLKSTEKRTRSKLYNKPLPGTISEQNRKIKSDPWTMEGRITGRVQRAEVSGETGWPAFPPRLSASSTTATRKT